MAQENKISFAKNTLSLSVITSISRVTGAFRFIALGTALGLAHVSNSYNLANTIPNMVYELILGGILTSIIIPIFVEYLAKEGNEGAWKVASLVINVALILLGAIFLAGTFLPYYFVRIQTLTVSPKEIELATFFFRFFAIQVVFYGLAAVATGLLHTYRRFIAPAVAPIFNNIIVISTVFFLFIPLRNSNHELSLMLLAIGTTVGVIAMFLIQIPSLFKIGFKYQFTFNFRHPAMIKLFKLSVPLFFYVASNQLQLTVENNLAFPQPGGISAITFTWPFFQLPFGVFAVSIITALFPSLSKNAALKDMDSYKKDLSLGIRTTALVIIPSSVILIVLSKPILSFIMGYGKMKAVDISIMSPVLSIFSMGLVSFALFMFLLKAFYALQDSATPSIINAVGVGLLIITDLLLINKLGVTAIAVGRAVFFNFMLFALFIFLRRKIGQIGGKKIFISASKSLFAGFIMLITVYYSKIYSVSYLSNSVLDRFLLVLVPSTIGIVVFILVSYIIKNEELSSITKLFKRRFA